VSLTKLYVKFSKFSAEDNLKASLDDYRPGHIPRTPRKREGNVR